LVKYKHGLLFVEPEIFAFKTQVKGKQLQAASKAMPFFVLPDLYKCTKQSSDSPHDDPSCSSQQAFETPENKEDDENGSAPVNRGSAPVA
jgi:hypothetical protein